MPLYDFVCQACEERFEELVRAGDEPVCPACGGGDLERLISSPTVRSETTGALSSRAATRRDAGQARDRMNERLRYEKSHDRHG